MEKLVKPVLDHFRESIRYEVSVSDKAVEKAVASIVRAYNTRHREYHSLSHIQYMIDILTKYTDNWASHSYNHLLLAAFFHDAMYTPGSRNNEWYSAEFARSCLTDLKVSIDTIAEVMRLVQMTETHTTYNEDADGKLFIDADMAILAADEEKYRTYSVGVFREYAHPYGIAFATFVAGRKKFLQTQLDKDRIFLTDTIRDDLEIRANNNMAAELEAIES